MRPIASLLMRCGMTWKEFAELCKSVFVEVASEEYGIKGRKTNVSRTAILTGVSRKEVKRQRDLLDAEVPVASGKTTDATRVLSAWHQDESFLDKHGNPQDLPLEGAGASFAELLRRYGGDIPSGAMLKELKHANVVEEVGDGKLRAISRYYMPVRLETESLLRAGGVLRDLAATLNNNVTPAAGEEPRFEGIAVNDEMDPSVVPAFRDFMDKEGQKFLEKLDDWLTERSSRDSAQKEHVRLGIGVYAIEDHSNSRGSK